MTTYRAAVWLSDDKQAEVLLTPQDMSHMSDDELRDHAEWVASVIGMDISTGEIVITNWSEK